MLGDGHQNAGVEQRCTGRNLGLQILQYRLQNDEAKDAKILVEQHLISVESEDIGAGW